MSTNLTAVLQELLQNTTNLKVLSKLMTPDVTYVSLNFDNPELKKIEPWAGTRKGPQALSDVFAATRVPEFVRVNARRKECFERRRNGGRVRRRK